MQKFRSLHLYLGCTFAPMLLFFAVSGIWQMYGFRSSALALLSTIHTSRFLILKVGSPSSSNLGSLSSSLLRDFELAMAVAFIITTILGVVMALKYGRSRPVTYACLALGVLFPLGVILATVYRQGFWPKN